MSQMLGDVEFLLEHQSLFLLIDMMVIQKVLLMINVGDDGDDDDFDDDSGTSFANP